MQRMTWRTIHMVKFCGIVLFSGLFTTSAPITRSWDFGPIHLQAQQKAPKPEAAEAKPVSGEKIPIFSGGKSNQSPPTESKTPTPETVVNSLSPESLPPKLSARQTAMLKQSPREQQQIYREAADQAIESIRTCKESFDRGLMPLSDFADQASAAVEVQLAIADLRGDRSERVKALSDHFELMKTAARQLEAFDQPASAGWAADAAYVSLLAANAELRLAAVRGDQEAYNRAAEQGTKLAEQHYSLRLTDFQNGHAPLSLLAKAANYLTTMSGLPGGSRDPVGEVTKYEEYLGVLDDVVSQTQKFAQQGAGIGREDRLYQAQFELARAEGQAALQKRNLELAAQEFNLAENSSEDWLASQLKFHQTGTASLRDVTQAWWSRAELSDISQRSGIMVDDASQRDLETDFNRLQEIVSNTTDRQGRIAADIAYVKSLGSLESLWARQRAVQAMATFNQATPAKSPLEPNRGSRVIEIKPQSQSPQPKSTAKTIPGTTPTQSKKSKNSPIEIVKPKRIPD